ncbi:MAG: TIGR02391 family protein [Clostridiales Family XIII bacterium]|nr:TIGR02391 family protein [Clostridiales Family XIII bacterium]
MNVAEKNFMNAAAPQNIAAGGIASPRRPYRAAVPMPKDRGLGVVVHLVRNPAAHTPKINRNTDETEALDVLEMISLAHKYLDKCDKVPRLQNQWEAAKC